MHIVCFIFYMTYYALDRIYNVSYRNNLLCISDIIYVLCYMCHYSHPPQQGALPVVSCGNGVSEMLVSAELIQLLRDGWRMSILPPSLF